jgi:hypothetical protein
VLASRAQWCGECAPLGGQLLAPANSSRGVFHSSTYHTIAASLTVLLYSSGHPVLDLPSWPFAKPVVIGTGDFNPERRFFLEGDLIAALQIENFTCFVRGRHRFAETFNDLAG